MHIIEGGKNMDKTTILISKEFGKMISGKKIKNLVLIEGLPGIGLVGKLAAEHLIHQLKAKKVAELYSPHFPHQVFIRKDGTISLPKCKFYLWKNTKKNGKNLLILIGDVQALTPEAQYEINGKIDRFFKSIGGEEIITLGGYGTGNIVSKKYKVFGAVTDKKSIKKLKKVGVTFYEASGSIVGAAGLLIGLGKMNKLNGFCLMGETHGNYVDAGSAEAVLNVLCKYLDIKIDLKDLKKLGKKMSIEAKKIEKQLVDQGIIEEEGEEEFVGVPGSELGYIR